MSKHIGRHVGASVLLATLLGPAALIAQDKDKKDENELQKCERPLGTLAVVEPQDLALTSLRRFNLQSPTSLIRMMAQQSNCFQVVERGVAMQNMMEERDIDKSGQQQSGSQVGGGMMMEA